MNLISIRKYDRKRENLNKIKTRSKVNVARAKSYQNRLVPQSSQLQKEK